MGQLRKLKNKIKSKLTREDKDNEDKSSTPGAKYHPHTSSPPSAQSTQASQTVLETLPQPETTADALSEIPLAGSSKVPSNAMDSDETKEPSELPDPASLEPSLWDEAYDSLKGDPEHGKLVLKYEEVLKTKYASEAGKSDLVDENSGIDPSVRDKIMRQIAAGDMERARLLKDAIEAGRKRNKTADKAVSYYRVFFDYMTMYQPIIEAGLQNASEAALPLAAFTSALELLARPAKLKKSNASGIKEVAKRLDWYLSIADHMLGKRSLVDLPDLEGPRAELKKRILSLYEAVLMYQMKSVCSYYRRQGWEFLRGFISLDSWDGDLGDVTKAEAELQKDANRLSQAETRELLEKMAISANAANNILLQIDQDKKDRECLQDLFVVNPLDHMTSILSRREEMIDGVSEWILDTKEFQHFSERSGQSPNNKLLWIKGHAGSGKTMLFVRVVKELQRRRMGLEPKDLTSPDVVFHFFEGTDSTLNKASSALKSIIWMLIQQQPRLVVHFRKDHEAAGSKLFTNQFSFQGLGRKLQEMLQDDELENVVIALDALDECNDAEKPGRTALVNLIVETLGQAHKVSWLLSSRPLHDLDIKVAPRSSQHHQSISSVIELDSDRITAAVKFYIDYTVGNLRQLKDEVWEEQHFTKVLRILKERATNTFLWVWLVVKELKEADAYQISDILHDVPPDLLETYGYILNRVFTLRPKDTEFCKKVLTAVALTLRPVAVCELSALADLPLNIPIKTILSKCGSFVLVHADVVHTIHQSAQDFLIDKYKDLTDGKPVSDAHLAISRRCLSRLSGANGLKRNIRDLPNMGAQLEEVETPSPVPPLPITSSHSRGHGLKRNEMSPPKLDLLAPIRYSCVFWANHLCIAGSECSERQKVLADDGQVHKFLKEHFLHWLESLSLLGKLSDGIQLISRLLVVVQQQPTASHQLLEFLNDAEKFAFSFSSIIEQAPLQAYGSALVFSPTTSKVRETYWEERPPEIHRVAGIRCYWEAYRHTLKGHKGNVNAIAFSPDGTMLASASDDNTIRLWDAMTGSARQTLEGHAGKVNSVAFSPDGKILASASDDKIGRLWDVMTGDIWQTLEGCTGAIAFSPDGKMLASASDDNTINFLDATTGAIWQTLKGCTGAIAFSPDGTTLASASDDNTIRFWDATTGSARQTLKGHTAAVIAIAFSPDGTTLASSSLDKYNTVCFWDATTGSARQTLKGHTGKVHSVAFSPDGKMLISATYDTLWLWDATTMTNIAQHPFETHTSWVKTVAFSPDRKTLASASYSAIGLWDVTMVTGTDMTADAIIQQKFGGHAGWVIVVAFSPDSKMLASASTSGIIQLWDATMMIDIAQQTLKGHTDRVTALAFSPNGKMLASASDDKTIRLWDTTVMTGAAWQTLEGHTDKVLAVAFSPNGKMLASGSYDNTIRLWNTTMMTGAAWQTLEGHTGMVLTVAFSPNGKMLASGSYDMTIRLWDIKTGAARQKFEVDRMPVTLSFDTTGSSLITDLGAQVFPVNRPSTPNRIPTTVLPQTPYYSISLDREWITWDSEKLLWLPQEYRPTWSAVAQGASKMAIGCRTTSGVLLFEFSV